MTTSAQIESESERTRSHLNDTMAELRSRMTVGQVADQVWEFAKDGLGGDFVKTLARQAANNPMPVTLIGTGLAWLMFAKSDGRSQTRTAAEIERAARGGDGLGVADDDADATNGGASRTMRGVKNTVKETIHGARDAAAAAGSAIAEGYDAVTEGASDLASSAYDATKEGVESAKVTAETAYDAVKQRAMAAQDMAASAYETVKESAMKTTEMAGSGAKAAGEYASDKAQHVADFVVENPLVLIGAGVALGALTGALLPATEMENELMGDASDSVKSQAEHLAAAQVEKVEKVGAEIIDRAAESATREFAAVDVDADVPNTGMSSTQRQGNIAAP